MLRLTARSLMMFIASALGGSLLIFFMLRMLRGDVALVMLGMNATPEALESLRAELSLNEPWYAQYLGWINGVLRGDLGKPHFGVFDVADEIGRRLGLTVSIALISLVVSAMVALFAGVYAAVYADRRRGVIVDMLAQVAVAMPSFWVGILLVGLLSVKLGWLPSGGYVPWAINPWHAAQSLVLPVTAVSISLAGALARYVRSTMLEVLSEDYLKTAVAKGRTYRQAIVIHGIRNASVPLVTVGTLTLGGLLTGVVVVEVVFSLPGMGRMLLDAVFAREVVVVQSVTFVFLALILMLNFAMDIAYGFLDPRIRDARKGT
ncbi:ABC transporter permease [Phytoactinopolyspora halotolerans]|uniref:ABC transporter permease n=1 Tax=Phytoactinopolyspora halotolerans TaxID=1981512 RepID=A0A6L9SIL6_9ACTN|nr:ABC transporter permease [Phytoactinopolyspora halotolerans]NEE03910.1 ABC transporter permease [Phytoactinopolyspora halotolerans]